MFERPWPQDLPSYCPNCSKQFRSKVNLMTGPGQTARFLKNFAYWMIIPWMILATVAAVFMGMPNGGLGGGYAIIGMIFIPPALLALASVLFPLSRRVTCACGWHEEFPMATMRREDTQ